MIDYNIKKITGDLGNFINVSEIAWCDENGYIVCLESVDLNNREFNWTAEPGAHYISISKNPRFIKWQSVIFPQNCVVFSFLLLNLTLKKLTFCIHTPF